MKIISYRTWQIFLTLLSVGMLLSSYYLEYKKGFSPCPLCIMQRFCALILFILSLFGMHLRTVNRQRWLSGSQVLIALAGLFFALRQLWLQSFSTQAPACMPGLDVLIRYFPWKDVLQALVWGAGDCAEVSWQLLGLSIPAWASFYFLAVLIVACVTSFNSR